MSTAERLTTITPSHPDPIELFLIHSAQTALENFPTAESDNQTTTADPYETQLTTDAQASIITGLEENILWYQRLKTDVAQQTRLDHITIPVASLLHLLADKLPSLPRRKKFTLWQSASYFRPTENITENQRLQRLRLDLITFFHEYVGFLTKKIYPYSQYGILDGYDVPVSDICRHHQVHLAELGLETARASLETYVAESLEAWFDNDQLPIGSKLVSISPPGTLAEGYPGKQAKNYAFVNVYQKIGDHEFQLVQYLSYDREQHLAELLNLLQQDHPAQLFRPQPLPLEPSRLDHHVITQLLSFDPDLTFDQFETLLYRRQEEWPKKLSEFPDLHELEPEFNAQIQAILNLCSSEFSRLYQTENPTTAATHFDLLIDTVRKKFLVWVQDHAANYHPGETITPTKLNLAEIKDYWLKRVAKEFQPEELTKEDKHTLRAYDISVRLNPLLPLGRLASVAHCVTMTPPSLALKAGSLSIKMQMLEGAVGLSFESRRPRFTDYQPLTLTDPETGLSQTWYILKQFYDEYKNDCFFDNGISYGPKCVALSLDARVLSEADYLELQQQNALESLEQTVTELAPTVPPDQHNQLASLVATIKNRILRPSISPNQLLTNDFFDQRKLLQLNHDLFTLITQLQHESQPLLALEQFVWKLVAEDQTEELAALTGEAFTSPATRQSRYN